ncbi:cytosolic sulfotransferase 5-like [Neltuma alba]|uniref:cytosolic sulfotransferase 5-like n=1 Tax=Neltuma alba TaxID=207710 RepID=UPI0010A4A040|nr:cytosolic sulfotransferase 5-like [Prosopis alba]
MVAEKSSDSNLPTTALPLLWDEDNEGLSQECKDLIATLPTERHLAMHKLYQYQGFWFPKIVLQALLNCQHHFQAHDSDILLITSPKCGTTWLKALTFAILNRKTHHPNPTRMPSSTTHPLLTANPHALVRTLETTLYTGQTKPDLSLFSSSPRVFATHLPYVLLPESIKLSRCKIVYLCRNPKDQFISAWHFQNMIRPEIQESNKIEELFEQYCRGVGPYGPFWDHMLEYYKKSLENPNKIMFLRYEDMKGEPHRVLKDLAGFIGYGFSKEEEDDDIVGDILRLCSFENLSNLKVNKSEKMPHGIENKAYFRRGEVGDWKNFLKFDMAEQLDAIIQEKLEKHGLKF